MYGRVNTELENISKNPVLERMVPQVKDLALRTAQELKPFAESHKNYQQFLTTVDATKHDADTKRAILARAADQYANSPDKFKRNEITGQMEGGFKGESFIAEDQDLPKWVKEIVGDAAASKYGRENVSLSADGQYLIKSGKTTTRLDTKQIDEFIEAGLKASPHVQALFDLKSGLAGWGAGRNAEAVYKNLPEGNAIKKELDARMASGQSVKEAVSGFVAEQKGKDQKDAVRRLAYKYQRNDSENTLDYSGASHWNAEQAEKKAEKEIAMGEGMYVAAGWNADLDPNSPKDMKSLETKVGDLSKDAKILRDNIRNNQMILNNDLKASANRKLSPEQRATIDNNIKQWGRTLSGLNKSVDHLEMKKKGSFDRAASDQYRTSYDQMQVDVKGKAIAVLNTVGKGQIVGNSEGPNKYMVKEEALARLNRGDGEFDSRSGIITFKDGSKVNVNTAGNRIFIGGGATKEMKALNKMSDRMNNVYRIADKDIGKSSEQSTQLIGIPKKEWDNSVKPMLEQMEVKDLDGNVWSQAKIMNKNVDWSKVVHGPYNPDTKEIPVTLYDANGANLGKFKLNASQTNIGHRLGLHYYNNGKTMEEKQAGETILTAATERAREDLPSSTHTNNGQAPSFFMKDTDGKAVGVQLVNDGKGTYIKARINGTTIATTTSPAVAGKWLIESDMAKAAVRDMEKEETNAKSKR